LSLSSEKLVSKFAFKLNLYCYMAAAPAPNRHMKKVKRLVQTMLPAGAEALLEKHLDHILANVDDPKASGRVGAAGVPAVTLAQAGLARLTTLFCSQNTS
jgi:hypothetical protein